MNQFILIPPEIYWEIANKWLDDVSIVLFGLTCKYVYHMLPIKKLDMISHEKSAWCIMVNENYLELLKRSKKKLLLSCKAQFGTKE